MRARLAAQSGVDLSKLAGSGPEAVIIAADVARARPSMAEVAHSLPQVDVPGQGRAMTSMEKAVSHAMTASLTLPTFHVTVNVDTAKLTAAAKARKVSVTVAIAKACSVAMAGFPRVNWAYQPVDKLVERPNHDFGVAVKSADGGLVVAILHGIERKGLEELQASWNDLVAARTRAQAGAGRICQSHLHHFQHGHVRDCAFHRHSHARHCRHPGNCRQRSAGHAIHAHRRSPGSQRRRRGVLPDATQADHRGA